MLVISADVGLITSLRRGLQTEPFCIIPGGILPCFPACWPPCAEIPTRRWRRASAPAVVQRRTKVAVPQRLHAPSGVSGQHSAAVRMPRAFFGSVVHIVGFVVDFSVI